MGLDGLLAGSGMDGALDGTAIHQYDTGLFRPQRTTLRKALVDRLAQLLVANGGYLRSIVELPHVVKGPDDLGILSDAVQGQAPCLCVALGKKSYEPVGQGEPSFLATLEVAIYVASTNSRGRIEGRLATDVVGASAVGADPGVETMLEHVEELLIGQNVNIHTFSEFEPESEDEVWTGDDATVWEQRYSVGVRRELDPDRLISVLALSIEAKHQLHGQLPQSPIIDNITTLGVP